MSWMRKAMGKRGFTLVELLVVIAIIGILMAVLFPAINNALFRGRILGAAANARSIMQAIYSKDTEGIYLEVVAWPTKGSTQPDSNVFATSTDFFKYCITNKVLEVQPNFFATGGLKPAKSINDFQGGNNAWSFVAGVADSYYDTAPVLISQNLEISTIGQALTQDAQGKLNDLQDSTSSKPRPFGKKGFVFATKTGSAFALYGDSLRFSSVTNMFMQKEPNATTVMTNQILNPFSM